jgi:hypothetical protein
LMIRSSISLTSPQHSYGSIAGRRRVDMNPRDDFDAHWDATHRFFRVVRQLKLVAASTDGVIFSPVNCAADFMSAFFGAPTKQEKAMIRVGP